MFLSKKIIQLWKNKSITFKFGVGISLLLFLIVLVSLTGFFSLRYVSHLDVSIEVNTEIRRMALEMDRGMERARRLCGEFFFNYPLIGFHKAHENYAQPSVRQTAEVVSLSKALRKKINQADVSQALRRNNINLNLYLSSANRFAETSIESFEFVTLLLTPETGLEAQLENQITGLRFELGSYTDYDALFYEMGNFIHEYRIKRKRFLMQSAFNVMFELKSQIELNERLKIAKKNKIYSRLSQIRNTGNEILAIDIKIKRKLKDFVLQGEAADMVSKNLITIAGNEVKKSQQRIQEMLRLSSLILISVMLAGLVFALLIAYVLNQNITRRIVQLTNTADRMKKGDLDVRAEEGDPDELGLLGRAFNYMAVRLKELILKLEYKVEQRTIELVRSERRFRQLFEHSNSGVIVLQPVDDSQDFVIKDANKAVEKIEKIKRSEVLGQKLTEVFPGVEEFGLLEVFRRVALTGLSEQYPLCHYSDERLQGWRENSVYKLPSGEIVSVYDDKTEEMKGKEERREMAVQLERAKKMEAIGLLAGGVAHDLNNILAGIVGYPELILEDLPEDSSLAAPLRAIHDSGQRATAVVADLLTVARSVANKKTDKNLNSIVSEYMVSPEFMKLISVYPGIEYSLDLFTSEQVINCSSVHVKKCIMNLITNAVEAIDGSGTVLVSTINEVVDKSMAIKKGIKTGEYLVLKVSDTGQGIPQDNIQHIFEPFYTKKVMGKSGTGLGLAVVWNSMLDHDGAALVESSDKGTTFSLYFPVAKQETEIVGENNLEQENLMGNGEEILIVDDEPQLRVLAKRFLEKLGYMGTCVASGEEALDYIKQKKVDLVLLDMQMEPGMNGCQTYQSIIEHRPDQKAVIASGFSESDDVKKAMTLGVSEFLLKPYSRDQIGVAVKNALK